MKTSIVRAFRITFLAAPLALVSTMADTWTWNTTTNNLTWSSSNWTVPVGAATAYPTGIGSTADFGQVSAGNARTVSLDLDVTVGSILMNSPYAWNLSRSSTHASNIATITINNAGNGGLISLSGGGGAFNQSSTLGNNSTTQYLRLSLADNLTIRTGTTAVTTYTIHTPTVGTGNLVINSNSAGAMVFSAVASLDHAGSITNSGTGSGGVTINSVIGANITGISQSSATSKLILAGTGANTFTGPVTVSSGTLELGAANRITDTGKLVMAGGTFATGGFSETLGTLSLTANSVIDLGAGTSALAFAASGTEIWGSSVGLSFINYTEGVDSIRFGIDAGGLTAAQLAQITINGESVAIDGNGFLTLVAIPEPSTLGILAGIAGVAFATVSRKRR